MPFSYTKMLRKSVLKGVFGGHRGWQVGLSILVLGQLLRKALKKGTGEVTHRQKISIGETLEVRHLKKTEEKLSENE